MFNETTQFAICMIVTGIFIGMVIGLYLGMNSTTYKTLWLESEDKVRRLIKDGKRLEALIIRLSDELKKDEKEDKG